MTATDILNYLLAHADGIAAVVNVTYTTISAGTSLVLTVVAVASGVVALTPVGAAGTPWFYARRILNALALNIKNAKNAEYATVAGAATILVESVADGLGHAARAVPHRIE